MAIWIVFAAMTVVLVALLLRPLRRGGRPAQPRAAFGQAVFRDQLAELERDVARGAIGAAEAAAARNEIARRLIGESESAGAPVKSSRWAPWLAAALVPIIALPLYLHFGSPGLKDVPLAERLTNAVANDDFDALVAKVEAHLAANPHDVQGWSVIAPAYKSARRYGDAANAYANVLRFSAPTADLYANYAEMLVYANGGMVTAEAANGFSEALKLEPRHPAARFFSGLAYKQEGKTREALQTWKALLDDSPADAPWRPGLEREIADLSGVKAPVLSDEQVAAAGTMNAQDRQTMIHSMVDGLEARLQSNGDDFDGWQRLIRARAVLGEMDKAKAAYVTAKDRFKDKPELAGSLDELAKSLRIGVP